MFSILRTSDFHDLPQDEGCASSGITKGAPHSHHILDTELVLLFNLFISLFMSEKKVLATFHVFLNLSHKS